MNINLDKYNRGHWFEDAEGNILPYECSLDIKEKYKNGEMIYFKHSFPLEVHEYIDEYCYHPTNPFIKLLCRYIPGFYNWFSKGKERTFKTILDGRTTFGGGQECIVAMVNSGNYTLGEAIWIYANSCERCMNVLERKYLGEGFGYEEFSEEWEKAHTVCDFCRGIENIERVTIAQYPPSEEE